MGVTMQLTASRRWLVASSPVTLLRESTLFMIGTGVIALHVVDDNFLQPQPDVSAGDHLVSGLVPLGLLTLAALLYPQLRAALRATVALLVGALGLVMGLAEAGYYTFKVGPSGDDFSGLLAIPASLLLLAVGAMVLWRMRQFADSRSRRYLRRFGFACLGALIVWGALLPTGAAYVFTHAQRTTVPAADLGSAYEDVSFTTSDGITLVGWYVPSTNGAAIVIYPGRTGGRVHARMLVRHGYGVLLFDRRGEGESGGDPTPWVGNRDVKAALAFLATRPDIDPDRIGGLGLSVGGEMLLQTAAETEAIKAVVSEGAGVRSIREHLEMPRATKWLELPSWLLHTAASTVLSNHVPPPNLREIVGEIAPRPILLIYATNGMGGEELNPAYFAAAGEPKWLWEITVAGHTDGIDVLPDEYERRVIEFLNLALLDGE
jgi:hypothetical protein